VLLSKQFAKGIKDMPTDYIPFSDAGCMAWLDNNSAMISASPATYGIQTTDAADYATLVAAFDAALAAATAGSTRGPSTVNAKNVARVNAVTRARQLAAIIQNNPGVTQQQKIDLGYTVRKTTKTPIPAPATVPILSYVGSTYLEHTLRFADQNTPSSKAKPFGYASLLVSIWLTAVGTAPSGSPTRTQPVTRNPFAVDFSVGDLGKLATYQAQWVSAKGELGPICGPIAYVVA
jgi:hypothetical protein